MFEACISPNNMQSKNFSFRLSQPFGQGQPHGQTHHHGGGVRHGMIPSARLPACRLASRQHYQHCDTAKVSPTVCHQITFIIKEVGNAITSLILF